MALRPARRGGDVPRPLPERLVRVRLGRTPGAPDAAPTLAGDPGQRPREQRPRGVVRVADPEPRPRVGHRRAHVHLAEPRRPVGRPGRGRRPGQPGRPARRAAGHPPGRAGGCRSRAVGRHASPSPPRRGARRRSSASGPGSTVDDGADVWADFAADGSLDDTDDRTPSRPGEAIAAAVAATFELDPGESPQRRLLACLGLPGHAVRLRAPVAPPAHAILRHGRILSGLESPPKGSRGAASGRPPSMPGGRRSSPRPIARTGTRPRCATSCTPTWSTAERSGRIARPMAHGPPAFPGPFALLECFDYPFYNTLDVYFYASFALVHLWPELAKRVIRDFVATVAVDDPEVVPVYATGGRRSARSQGPCHTTSADPPRIRSSCSTPTTCRTSTAGRT